MSLWHVCTCEYLCVPGGLVCSTLILRPPLFPAEKLMLALRCPLQPRPSRKTPTSHHCMQVLENRELQGGGSDRSTRHVQLQLPEGPGGAYSSGEHLEVYGNNDGSLVEAALKLLGLGGATGVVVVFGGV